MTKLSQIKLAAQAFGRMGGKARAKQKHRPEVSVALRGYWNTPKGMARRRKPAVVAPTAPAVDPALPVGGYQ